MELTAQRADQDRPDAGRFVGVHTRLNGVLLELLELVTELDTAEARLANSVPDLASWLQFDLGVAPKTARVWVQVAHALVGLPAISAAFRAGAVSLDEVQVLCRHGTPDNEIDLLALTRQVRADELSAAVREFLDLDRPKPVEPQRPLLRMWWTDEALQLRGSIPGADGVLVETTLLRLAAKAPLDPETGLFRDSTVRYGEALVQMSSEALAEERDHDRATVVVHVAAAALRDPDASVVVGGRRILRDELLQLTCDGRVQPAIDDPEGFTVGIGRVSRQIPGWLRRLVMARDGGCRFPRCGRTRWTHSHHIVHWADDGTTNLDNLLTLCGFHHRLIHRQGWRIEGNPNRDVRFINQWGKPHIPARPQFPPDHQHRLVDYLDHYAEHRLGLLATARPIRRGSSPLSDH